MQESFIFNFIVWYAAFLFSTSCHEAGHALFAYYGNDYTAYNNKQLTLDPIPHIKREPLGMVVVPILSFILNEGNWMIGWASVPFNPIWAARYPKKSFLMSLAGPATHLITVILCVIIMIFSIRMGWFVPNNSFHLLVTSDNTFGFAIAKIVSVMFILNTVLLVFNILPLSPMDGSEIIYLFINREEDRLQWREISARYSLIGLLIVWKIFSAIFSVVIGFFISVIYWFALGY